MFLFCSAVLFAQEDNQLRKTYMDAEEAYSIGHFDDAVELLSHNLPKYSGPLKTSAFRLLALCRLGQDDDKGAEDYVSKMLKDDPYYNVTLQDPMRFVDIVDRLKNGLATITTASQQAETLDEVPVPVTLITEEMIKESGARDLAEVLLLYVPGMSLIGGGSETNIAMHGVYSNSQETMLIMLNGHRLNSRTTNAEAPDFRNSLDKIKQIEVLRGPASSLYGNVALTSVVNIITKSGHDVDGVKLSGGTGSNNTYQANLLIGKSGVGIDFMAWASVYSSKGEKRNINTGDDEYWGRISQPGSMYINGFNNKPSYDLGMTCKWNEFSLLLNTQYSKKVSAYSAYLYPSLYSYDKYRTVNGDMPGHSRRSTHIELNYNKTFGEWSGKLTGFADFEECSSYDIGADSVMPGAIMFPIYTDEIISDLNDSYNHQGVFQVQSWNDYTFGGSGQLFRNYRIGNINGTLLFGTQFENYCMHDNTTVYGDSYSRIILTLSDNNRTIQLGHEINVSGFVQIKANLTKKLMFNVGLRYDHKQRYNDKILSSFSPRLSLIYKLNTDMTLKGGFSQSFVDAPFYYRANNLSLYAGGSELDAERMSAGQLTFNWNIKPLHLKYEANGYFNRLDNIIYYNATNKAQKVSNSGILNLLGIENVFTYEYQRLTANLSCSYQFIPGSINYAADGNHINNVPNFILNATGSYKAWQTKKAGNIKLRANVNVLSEQYSPIVSSMVYRNDSHVYLPYNKIKARAIFNGGIDYDWKKFDVSLTVYNLLGTDYYQGGADRVPEPQQHRSFMVNVSYNF